MSTGPRIGHLGAGASIAYADVAAASSARTHTGCAPTQSVQRLTYQYGHEEEFSRNGVGIGNGHAYMVREISDFLLTLESQAVHLVHYRWSIRYPPVTPEYLYQFLFHKLQGGR